jgi:nucleotide-binding universal stress UspA family protein
MKLLVAADGSPTTKRMLAYLAAHDEWMGAHHDYTVLTAVPAVPPRAASVLDKTTLKAYYDDEAEKVFKPIRAFFSKQGLKAQFVSKVGSPGEVVPEFANKGKFDLIVLGSHGHGSFTNLVMGSVATKVLAHCDTPALLIR